MSKRIKTLTFISIIIGIIAGVVTIFFTAHNTYATKNERILGDEINNVKIQSIKTLIENQNKVLVIIQSDIKTLIRYIE